ncbi:MAG: DUF11 domain-containing protein [Methanobrevibacter sp.]|nr:DUF11 domain-containing protein [Methanobrevibacter sp.]
MKSKSILYIFLMLIFLSTSIGIVSASEDIADSTTDFLSVEQDVIIEEEILEVNYDTSYDEVTSDIPLDDVTNDISIDDNESEKTSLKSIENENVDEKTLLGISNEEDYVLQSNNIIKVQGNYFSDVRDAITIANDGDIIDLEGKEIIGAKNGNPSISTEKHLTFINGIFNAGNITSIPISKRNEIKNCNFENITFKNFNDVCMYPNFFVNCNLNHVLFDNFTLAVAGFVIRNSNLYDVNFTNCHSLEEEDENDYEYAAMAVTYNSVLDHCNFINCTTNRHSGAICVAGERNNRVDIFNSNFINCSAGVGGAIYVHGNAGINENYHSNIINCTFIGNTATERGGAIGSSQNYLVVKNCTFENNTAKQGAAYMLAGIDHGLDGIPEGHYNNIVDCYFRNNTGTEEGGAVHITGNYNNFINCTFWDNYATNGNGSAIYIHGQNSSVINSEFYEHECSRGTIYIIGDNTFIDNSTFENNTASRGGAGVYVVGNNTLVNNSVFNNNDAIFHGGALHSQGDNLRILNSNFTSNTAIASTEDMNQGLGGAIYIEGENSDIAYCYFENNVARNGSAIYNRGKDLTIEDDTFIENQAWSYLLTTISNKKRIYYDPEGVITINVTHRGGDNIINAIYNDGSPNNIFFYNVTYESSVNDTHNTGNKLINPVDGVENSKNGTILYQDSREDLQNITIVLTHLETGKVLINFTSKTGILGNTSVSEKGLLPGNYSVNVTHFEDGLYKYITNMTYFEILPVADLAVEKYVSNKTPNFGDEITWTIVATNYGFNNVSDAYVIDQIPDGLIFNGADGDYNPSTGVWNIKTLNVNQVVTLTIRTIVNITNTTILNIANVNSSTYDPNESNNIADNTTTPNSLADLSVIKLVSKETSVIGDEIVWTIVATNNGPDIAVDSYAIDILPSTLTYLRDDSNGRYNLKTGRWNIGNLAKGDTATLKITTRVNTDNTTIVNNVFVNSSTPDSNMDNNNASNSTEVLDSNFNVEKITITPLVTLGEQTTFQIIVRNTGLTDLTGVFIEESSYDGLIFSHSLNQTHWTHSVVNGKNRWTLNDVLGINQVTILSVVFNTTKVGTFTNVVVAGSNETENKTAKNDTVVTVPDFKVDKIALNKTVVVGELVDFEVFVRNIGLIDLTDVFIEETDYGEGLEFISSYSLGNWIEYNEGGKYLWKYNGTIAPGEAHGFFVVFNTTKAGNWTNLVTAGSNETGNKTDNETVEVVDPKFEIEKISLNPTVVVGEQVTFEIVVTNTGGIDLNNVFVEEFEYDGLVFDHAFGLGHWTESVVGGKHKWTFNNVLSVGEAHGFFVVFNTTVAGNFTNVVVGGADYTPNKTANDTVEVVEPKFTVEKVTLTPLVHKNNLTYFQIIVRNVGQTTLTGVFIEETDYENLTYHSYVDNEEWYPNFEDKYPTFKLVQSLKPNDVATLIVIFNATQTGNWTNTVTAGANNVENKTANNSTFVYENEPPYDPEKNATNPNLNVEKYVQEKLVLNGTQAIFEIIVRNTGDKRLHNVTIYEKFDEGLVFDHIIDHSGLWIDNGDLTFTFNDILYVGELSRFYAVFNTTKEGNFTNYVTVTSNESSNKTANDTVEVVVPEFEVNKISINKTVAVGDQVVFEVTVKNTGKVELNNVLVKEYQYGGLTYISWYDDTGLWIKNDDLSWSLNSKLSPKEYIGFFVVFNATDAGNWTNVIVVSSDETPNKTANDTVEVLKPELDVSKITINKIVSIGEEVIFEIIVRNTGEIALNDVVVKESSFDALEYLTWYDDTGLWIKNDDLSWSLKTILVPNEELGFFVVFNATDVGNWTNVIVIDSKEISNKTANDTVEVVKPEYTIEKVAINSTVLVGEEVTFEIMIKNTGKVNINNITVKESEFEGLEYLTWYDNTALWTKNDDLSWTLTHYISPEEGVAFFVVFNTTKTGHFTNVVVSISDKLPNQTANDTVDVLKSELTLQKVTVNKTVAVGNQVIFEIVVENSGDVTLNNITVTEFEFEGLEYVTWYDYTDRWAKNDDLTWTYLYPLESMRVADFFVVFNTTKIGNFTNVIVAKSDKTDDIYANNSTTVLGADLSVVKLVSNSTSNLGDIISWTVIVTNNGLADAKDVYVVDNLPAGLIYQSDDSNGAYDPLTGVWTIGDLAYGETATLVIDTLVNVTNANIVNLARVNSSTFDPDKGNNVANNTTTSNPMADLSIVKFVSKNNPNYGDVISWTIVVFNKGPDAANDVNVVDRLPSGLIYYNYQTEKGTFNPSTGVWTIGELESMSSVSLVIDTLVNVTNANIVNVASVNSSTPDPNMDNNMDNDTANVNSVADLSISKVVVSIEGNRVTWKIVVINLGPDTAVNTRVIDVLPNTLEFVSYDATKGSYDSINGVWTIGDIKNDEDVTLLVETIVVGTGEIINEARVVSDTYDPNMTNNYDFDVVIVEDSPDESYPVTVQESEDVLPVTGNPFIMVLLALIALGCAALRRKK